MIQIADADRGPWADASLAPRSVIEGSFPDVWRCFIELFLKQIRPMEWTRIRDFRIMDCPTHL